jgi:hypothetical protein
MESKQLEYKVRWRCSSRLAWRLERDEISFDVCALYYSCVFLGSLKTIIGVVGCLAQNKKKFR